MSPREKDFVTDKKQVNKTTEKIETLKDSSIIDLENETKTSVDFAATKKTLTYDSPIKPVRINSLEEALALSPQYDSKFVSDLKARYSAKERERQRLLAEEEIRCKVLAENREEWETQLEQRLRKQLEITKPVLDERVEEKVVLPEINDEMHKVIDKALNGYSESEVLCDAFNLTITRKDIKTLIGLNWLNDQVKLFYCCLTILNSSKTPIGNQLLFDAGHGKKQCRQDSKSILVQHFLLPETVELWTCWPQTLDKKSGPLPTRLHLDPGAPRDALVLGNYSTERKSNSLLRQYGRTQQGVLNKPSGLY